jgi:HSP20 family protein
MRTMYYPRRRWRHRWGPHWRHFEGVYVPLNVYVDDDNYLIEALVPGIKAEELEIEVLDNSITIEGEFFARDHEDMRAALEEQPTGRFSRTVNLRAKVVPEKAEAEVQDGVLTLRVPKAPEAKTRRISVKSK